ncbi:MrcB family domain-containing protein [Streptomyces sp. NPDC001339]|uniref:MrcB family domain-containing protein n=1 Tax=Streptomyces sp. NPDC001339 TaxID=3364563 RepID=UPI0036905988
MGIRDLLLDVANRFDTTLTTTSGNPGQEVLKAAGDRLATALPYGMKARGHGGKGGAAATPWIQIYESTTGGSGTDGLYLAYIFAADLKSVALTLQQGVTVFSNQLETTGKKLRTHLTVRAQSLLAELPRELVADWSDQPEFKHTGWRARAYEASSVAARCYEIDQLPAEEDLCADLGNMATILKATLAVEPHIEVMNEPEGPIVEYRTSGHVTYEGLEGFQPKTSDDYYVQLAAAEQRRTRAHEGLIRRFGPYILRRGFTPITHRVHPRDLVLQANGDEWLVEAKAVKKGNPTQAVREAVGQLLEYRYFWYALRGEPKPHLLGLFSEDIGVYTNYLEEHGIGAIWRTPDGWAGSSTAISWGMADVVSQSLT